MFVDSDDFVDEDYVESFVKYMQQNSVDLCMSGVYNDYLENGVIVNSSLSGISKELFFDMKKLPDEFQYLFDSMRTCVQSPCGKIYKTRIVQQNNLSFNTSMVCYEDFDFNIRYMCKCDRIGAFPISSYHYLHYTKASALSRRKKDDLTDEISILRKSWLDLENLIEVKKNSSLSRYMMQWFNEAYYLVPRKVVESKLGYKKAKAVLKHLYSNSYFIDLLNDYPSKLFKLLGIFMKFKLYPVCFIFLKFFFK